MSSPRLAWVSFAALLASVLLFARPLVAAPKDDKAQKAFKQAMEEDYLDTRFDDAEKKLKGAIDACGTSGCSPRVKARLHMALGIVLIGGKGKKEDGKQAFADGLKLDANAAPDPDYITSDIKTIFEEAKKSGGSSGPDPDSGSGMAVIPVAEQRVNTPVPIYVTVDEEAAKKVSSVTLTYSPTSGEQKEIELEKSGKGFRGNVPCGAVKKKGTLKFWVVGKDKKGKESLTVGSASAPLTTEIKAELNDKPPSWPGFAPPEQCAGGGGGDDAGGGGDDSGSSHRQCIDTSDCPSDERCAGNQCLKKPSAGGGDTSGGSSTSSGDDEEGKNAKLNWIRITFAPDFAMVSGEDVCGFRGSYGDNPPGDAFSDSFVCVKNPQGENKSRYLGQPTVGQGNNVNFGFGVATMRLMLGYDRVLIKGLSVGARIGWAFNGTNEEFASFIPVHAEGNLKYTIGANPFAGQVVRPWVFISGGLSQVDTAIDVDVKEDGESCGASNPSDPNSECTVDSADGVIEPRIQTLRAIKQAGLGFAGAGIGVSFVPVDLFEINLGVKFSVTIPVVVPVFSPELGIGFGF